MAVFTGTDSGEMVPGLLQAPIEALGDDALYGFGGDDILTGWTGNDVLNGGAGADILIGGTLIVVLTVATTSASGSDTADYTGSSAGVTIDLSLLSDLSVTQFGLDFGFSDVVQGHGGDAEGDILVNITNLVGSANGDSLAGNDDANGLVGAGGMDTLSGNAGNDSVYGGDGADSLYGGIGNDYINGGNGSGSSGDAIYGGDGDDTLQDSSLDFADLFSGGIGNDSIYAGGSGDIIQGDAGNDFIDGGLGNDSVWGGDDNDTLNGFNGNDQLYGGAGSDRFAFQVSFGVDVINDWQDGGGNEDVIFISKAIFADLAAVTAAMSQVGAHTYISAGGGSAIWLLNTTMGTVGAGDFYFF